MSPCYEFLYHIQCVYDVLLHARACAHIYVIPNIVKKITKKNICFKLEQKVQNIKKLCLCIWLKSFM
jgi:predicted metallopeptidase